MRSKYDLIESILKGRKLLEDVGRTGNDRKAVKGNIKDWEQQLNDGRFTQEEAKAVWMRDTYYVQRVPFDYSLCKFEVMSFEHEIIGTIYPDDKEAERSITADLIFGDDVDGWFDGQCGEIKIRKLK